MRALAILKILLSKIMHIDNFCRECGWKTETFTMDDALWNQVTGGSGPLCFRHFHQSAERKGLNPVWWVRLAALALLCIVVSFMQVSPVSAVELIQAGQPDSNGIVNSSGIFVKTGILLDVQTSFKVLQALEDYPKLKEESAALRAVVARHGELEEIRVEREKLYQDRIAFLELQAEKWKQLNDASLQLARDTRESQGSWWNRFLGDMGKFSTGAIIGAVIAAAIIL